LILPRPIVPASLFRNPVGPNLERPMVTWISVTVDIS
jgi:hypothetical protein